MSLETIVAVDPALRTTGFAVLSRQGTKVACREYGAIRNKPALRASSCLLAIRDQTGQRPHAYFGWTEGNPLKYLGRFIFFGEGDIAPVTREILRQTDPNPQSRPAIHVG